MIEIRRGFARLLSYGKGFLESKRHVLLSIVIGVVVTALAFNALERFAHQEGLGYWIERTISPAKDRLSRTSVLIVYNPFLTGGGIQFFTGSPESTYIWMRAGLAVVHQIEASVFLRTAESVIIGVVCSICSELAMVIYVDRRFRKEAPWLTRARLIRLGAYLADEAAGSAIIASKLLKFVPKPPNISPHPYIIVREPVLNSLDWAGLALAAAICSVPLIVEGVRYCRSHSFRKGVSQTSWCVLEERKWDECRIAEENKS